ncbi:hypothetical protein Taro_051050 [Colocasia esculenta]|uniref:Uncharacterized protein n=1 Tax=Colocasia esculenta TaxID=4460 RepID=A0A843XEY9_COLES|nr:hypothetical protein [Colocasia esculenta]
MSSFPQPDIQLNLKSEGAQEDDSNLDGTHYTRTNLEHPVLGTRLESAQHKADRLATESQSSGGHISKRIQHSGRLST